MNKRVLAAIVACGVLVGAVGCTDSKEGVRDLNGPHDNVLEMPEELPEGASAGELFLIAIAEPKEGWTRYKEDGSVAISMAVRRATITAHDRANRESKRLISNVLETLYNTNIDFYDTLCTAYDGYIASAELSMVENPWSFETNYKVLRNDAKVVSIMQTAVLDLGDGNPTTTLTTYNFDASNGAQFSQIFFEEGNDEQRDAADKVIFDKLVAKYGAENINYDTVQNTFVEEAKDTWYFTKDGAVVFFNPGEAADVSLGSLEISLTRDELPEVIRDYVG